MWSVGPDDLAERTLCQHGDSGIDTPTEVLRRFARSTRNTVCMGGRRSTKENQPVSNLLSKLRAPFTRRDDGASAVEYGLLVALIAVVIAGTVVILGNALSDKFKDACNDVAGKTCATSA